MCSIVEGYSSWEMNRNDFADEHSPSLRNDFPMAEESVDSHDLSLRSGAGIGPAELPREYTPGAHDVCCGRGKKNWRHHGNATFRKLIHANVRNYINASTKNDKTLVVKSIVDVIRQNGGRFVKQDSEGMWHDIGDSQAKEKVGHSLRDQVTALSKKDSGSSTRTPRRASSNSMSSFSQSSLGQGQSSQSPLDILRQLPSDLSILDQINFPSIHAPQQQSPYLPHRGVPSSGFAAASPQPALHQSQSFRGEVPSFASPSHSYEGASQSQSFHSSGQNFYGSSQSSLGSSFAQGINFLEPLDDILEPTPIREFEARPEMHPSWTRPNSDSM